MRKELAILNAASEETTLKRKPGFAQQGREAL
jgi:hypothetical protein